MEGFENSIDAKNLVYIKRTDNDSQSIIEIVDYLIKSLFNYSEPDKIIVEMKRITEWHTLGKKHNENI